MTDERKPFTVTDRRHFTREGEARTDADVSTPEESRSEGSVLHGAHVSPADPALGDEKAGPQSHLPDSEGPVRFPSDFPGLLVSLGTQAALAFQQGGGRLSAEDQDEVRSIIALLEALQNKTEGRRTPEEDRLLQGILYELRMGFVAKTRGGP